MNKLGNYFSDKYLMTSDSIPTEGSFEVGDIVINTGENISEEPFWVCTESGTPGVWQSINVKSTTKMVSFKNKVILTEATDTVNIGIDGFNIERDTLIVFINDAYAYEHVDYVIDGTNIKTLDNKIWNEGLIEDFVFEFIVFKSILCIDESGKLLLDQIPDGTLTINKFSQDIQEKLDFATTDLNIYQKHTEQKLPTNDKTIVGAINELFQNVDSGKQLIADAIDDETINKDSTFEAMSNAIVDIKDTIKDMEQDMNASAIDKAALAEAITNRGMITYETDSIEDMIASILKLGKVTDTRLDRTKLRWLTASIKFPTNKYSFASERIGNTIYLFGGETAYDAFDVKSYSFDFATEKFTAIANLPTGRSGPSSCVANGKIYCIGGYGVRTDGYSGNLYIGPVECYDPSTNTWSSCAQDYGRGYGGAASVNNLVYSIAGQSSSLNFYSNTRCYDPGTNTWTDKTHIPTIRKGFICKAVNGIIYCISGKYNYSDSALTSNVEAYDASTDTWSDKAKAPYALDCATGVIVGNKICCMGGNNPYQSSRSDQVSYYDTTNDSWSTKEPMSVNGYSFRAEMVDNIIICFAGLDGTSSVTKRILYYILRNETI